MRSEFRMESGLQILLQGICEIGNGAMVTISTLGTGNKRCRYRDCSISTCDNGLRRNYTQFYRSGPAYKRVS